MYIFWTIPLVCFKYDSQTTKSYFTWRTALVKEKWYTKWYHVPPIFTLAFCRICFVRMKKYFHPKWFWPSYYDTWNWTSKFSREKTKHLTNLLQITGTSQDDRHQCQQDGGSTKWVTVFSLSKLPMWFHLTVVDFLSYSKLLCCDYKQLLNLLMEQVKTG